MCWKCWLYEFQAQYSKFINMTGNIRPKIDGNKEWNLNQFSKVWLSGFRYDIVSCECSQAVKNKNNTIVWYISMLDELKLVYI